VWWAVWAVEHWLPKHHSMAHTASNQAPNTRKPWQQVLSDPMSRPTWSDLEIFWVRWRFLRNSIRKGFFGSSPRPQLISPHAHISHTILQWPTQPVTDEKIQLTQSHNSSHFASPFFSYVYYWPIRECRGVWKVQTRSQREKKKKKEKNAKLKLQSSSFLSILHQTLKKITNYNHQT